jgi:3-hydroxyacyl-CoA dehydrogenase/enoyl-CoA hydratase/3-hydroxybutyryl-CoA epimerase
MGAAEEVALAAPVMQLGEPVDGVATLVLDDPESSVNTITQGFGEQLAALLDRIESDDHIQAVVVTSAKRQSFIVGANIQMIAAIKFAADAERGAADLATLFGRIKASKKRFVAAVDGPALGGGFEFALACHAIVLSDSSKTVVALPEVQLGLLPGANGLLRVAERTDVRVALDLGLTGKNVRAKKAKALGLVDEVVPAAHLAKVAKNLAHALVEGKVPKKKKSSGFDVAKLQADVTKGALEGNPLGRRVLFSKAREELRKKTRGHYPAPERIVDVLERYASKGFAAAATLEAKLFGELVVSEVSARLVELFEATTALKKDTGTDGAVDNVAATEHIGVLGGGLMGGGIAFVTSRAGVPVRIRERDDAGCGRALRYVNELVSERVKKKQSTPLDAQVDLARITATTDWTGIKHADIVVEAVFEDLDLKQEMVRQVEAIAGEHTLFASNTSSIPITQIAANAKRPENVLGMHYFSPVHKMPLLEIIRTDKTSDEAVARAVALGKKQGKTVIVVRDGVGFYTSRILAPYLNEAAYLLAEGVAVDVIDDAMVAWGFPVGPLQLLDEVGIDVGSHVGVVMRQAFGDRMVAPAATSKLLADGRKGRKNGRGFYVYGEGAKKKGGKKPVDESVYKVIGVEPKALIAAEDIQMRCALQMVNEAFRCLGEGILRSPRDGDIGAIFGLGFPPFRGGPFRYVDTIGAAEAYRRIQGYHDRFGARWEPAPLLRELARDGKRSYT